MIKPPDCYGKSQLPKALGIGYERFYQIADDNDFPEPDGYYVGYTMAKKRYPYWHVDTVRDFIENGTRSGKKPKEVEPPWAIPAYDRQESIVSIRTRIFLNLMRVAA